MKYVIALDQGTTSSRAIVFDRAGAVRSMGQYPLTQHYPQPGMGTRSARHSSSSQQSRSISNSMVREQLE